ncbi:metallophosphoesterase [Streptomyces sp. NPDC047525]|uniref:metallophosphoesterase n=1 Tax=Streptomyces sp. NPDC047525 TaxID=3155264 RepID=UPI00340148CF
MGISNPSGEVSLFTVSDLHPSVRGDGPLLNGIRPRTPDGWLIVGGDVAAYPAEGERALRGFAHRLAKAVWASGNHELWAHCEDPVRHGPGGPPSEPVLSGGGR